MSLRLHEIPGASLSAPVHESLRVRVARRVTACRKSVLSSVLLILRRCNSSWRACQSSLSRKFSAANVAVSNSKTLSGTPPVLTFSKTVHTASFGVPFVRTITGTL